MYRQKGLMTKPAFESDYLCGAHPLVLERLVQTNLEATPGYGTDAYCAAARERIRAACGCPEAGVYFLTGGTQTNATVITALLRPWQGIISAASGHIATHEAGAIERGGHKILPLPHRQGKLSAADVDAYVRQCRADENWEHTVMPGAVYLSHPTEYGTLYTRRELEELSAVCKAHDLALYLDGARLAYALAAYDTDVTLADLARCCDVFYIGGTKCGALFGEAVVVPRRERLPHFFTLTKQHGALLAKGRLLGLQFDALFTDGLYFELGRHAIDMARRLKQILRARGYDLWLETPTNQQFVLLENRQMEALAERVGFAFWENADPQHTVVRFATSWATTREDLDRLEALL